MSTKVQLIGGQFQDSEGVVLSNGYLKMRLSQDSVVNTSQICGGVEITIQLDSAGNVASSTSTPVAANQLVWGNDQLLPINSFYRVTGYKANGQPAWGPNNQQVIGNGGTFDVGTWVPNSVVKWTPSPQIPFVQVNGVAMSSQAILDFENAGGVTWSDAGNGVLHASAGGGSGLLLMDNTGAAPVSQDFKLVQVGAAFDTGTSTATINLSGSAIFSGQSAYRVYCQAQQPNNLTVVSTAIISGSQFTVTATSLGNGQQLTILCVGNNAGG